jgi:hypothetical protein
MRSVLRVAYSLVLTTFGCAVFLAAIMLNILLVWGFMRVLVAVLPGGWTH